MRAKLMLLSGDEGGAELSVLTQEVLTELAMAFGHSFTIKTDVIGDTSKLRFGTHLTQNTLESAGECDAVLALMATPDGLIALANGLGCVLGSRVYQFPQSLHAMSLMKGDIMPQGIISFPLRDDMASLREAADQAYQWAHRSGMRVREVPFAGTLKERWVEALSPLALRWGEAYGTRTMLSDILRDALLGPQELGMVFAAPAAAEALDAVCDTISGLHAMVFDCYAGLKPMVYRAATGRGADSSNPFGVYLACADMLSRSLGLMREADCLLSSVVNVLDAGWRTADIAQENSPRIGAAAVTKLICEQIALAGQLMLRT